MDLFDNIKTNYSTYFSKYETSKNQLLSAILYSINILSNEDVNIMLKQFSDFEELINTNKEAFQLFMSFILNYIAINIIYYLPNMMNKPIQNFCCSVHNIFGESIAQLVAFCLVTEGSNILNSILKDHKHILKKIKNNICDNDEIILNSTETEISKQTILEDYNKKIELIINRYKEYYTILFNK
tara:strand:- start:63 stop:614 length:552 start_codon:yes stop_codon:yes gene_type:complete